MELISVNLARSIWLFQLADLNPKGKSLYPVIPWLVNLYKFKIFPTSQDSIDFTKGIRFEDGEFETKEGETINIIFTAYGDGLVADTRSSTTDSDMFLDDMLTKLSGDFNLPNYKQVIRRKTYLSQLYVRLEKSLSLINPKFKAISKYISDNIQGYSEPHYEIAGVSLWPDQTKAISLPLFTLERALNIPFSENRYYSVSGLETDKHLNALNKIEAILRESKK